MSISKKKVSFQFTIFAEASAKYTQKNRNFRFCNFCYVFEMLKFSILLL